MHTDDLENARRTWMCPGCHRPLPNTGAIDVRLESPVQLHKPMTAVSEGVIGIALRELLLQIDPVSLHRDLFLGRVFRSDGTLLDRWATFRGRHQLIIRGTTHISQRLCSACDRIMYFAMGETHLFPEPPSDASVYESDLSGIIVTDTQFRRLDISKWRRGVQIDQLRVADLAGAHDLATHEPT